MGCRHNPTAEKVHPLYRIRIQNGAEVKEFINRGDFIAEKFRRVLGLDRLEIIEDKIDSEMNKGSAIANQEGELFSTKLELSLE